MRFNIIVHAPQLRAGARLNVAEADQSDDEAPHGLSLGDEVALRFGVCCPDLSRGTITGYTARPESAVLAVGDRSWTILKQPIGGVTVPGLVSESWFVVGPETLA